MPNAIVFGGAGFLGSHVADELTKAGYRVTVFDMKESPYLSDGQNEIIGNILDKDDVDYAICGNDVVYNFAGVADIAKASENPFKTIEINVLGNMNILGYCVENQVKRFVFASSLYVNSKNGGFYRSSKRACEQIIEDYHDEFGLNYTILRYGSLYGLRANKFNWVYSILNQAIKERKITRRGDGNELREYINIKDAARYSVEILAKEFENECVVISGHQQMKVKDVMEMVKEMMGGEIELEFLKSDKVKSHYEITPYSFNPKPAKKYVGKTYYDMGQGFLECMEEVLVRK